MRARDGELRLVGRSLPLRGFERLGGHRLVGPVEIARALERDLARARLGGRLAELGHRRDDRLRVDDARGPVDRRLERRGPDLADLDAELRALLLVERHAERGPGLAFRVRGLRRRGIAAAAEEHDKKECAERTRRRAHGGVPTSSSRSSPPVSIREAG